MVECLILRFIFAIMPPVGNNFKTKIFSLLKQIYGGLSQVSIWRTVNLTEPIQISTSFTILFRGNRIFMKKGVDKMDNRKNIKIFTFILALLTVLFALSLTKTSAETPNITVSGKFVDTIKNINVTSENGGNIEDGVGKWQNFRINANYDLAGKNVKAGDTTDISISDPLIISSQSFEIRDTQTNQIIAHATVDKDNKKISLTYTDYVESHSDTNGSFYFYAQVDYKKHPEAGEVPVQVTVNNKTTIVGKVNFKGVGISEPKLFVKISDVQKDPTLIKYAISVNQNKQNIKEVTVEDHLQFTNAEYVKGSIRVYKGTFSNTDGSWQLNDTVDVTDQHTVTVSDDGQSFTVNLGDVTEADQYQILYDVRLKYTPADGEVLKNEATLKGKGVVIKQALNASAIQIAGGSGVGYVFTIHIHKVGDANQPLAGAKFKVVRQANNQVIGEYVTDKDGNITVNGLLKDKYILTELQAPEGYTITTADTPVNAKDFSGADHAVTKTIVNPKEKPKTTTTTSTTTTTTTSTTTTVAPTTSTTTTVAPTTSTTTTEAPSTSTTTTEAPSTSTTTTVAPTTSTTTTKETTTSTTTTEAPTTSTTTTPGGPVTTAKSTTTTPGGPSNNHSGTTKSTNGRRKGFLPNTGEIAATGAILTGVIVLSGAIVLKRKISNN